MQVHKYNCSQISQYDIICHGKYKYNYRFLMAHTSYTLIVLTFSATNMKSIFEIVLITNLNGFLIDECYILLLCMYMMLNILCVLIIIITIDFQKVFQFELSNQFFSIFISLLRLHMIYTLQVMRYQSFVSIYIYLLRIS